MEGIDNIIKHIEASLQDDNPMYQGVPKYLVLKLLDEYKEVVKHDIRFMKTRK